VNDNGTSAKNRTGSSRGKQKMRVCPGCPGFCPSYIFGLHSHCTVRLKIL
jgi:hypothetical protein